MPKALMLGPLIVLSIYVLYFIGISCYVTPEVVMTLGIVMSVWQHKIYLVQPLVK